MSLDIVNLSASTRQAEPLTAALAMLLDREQKEWGLQDATLYHDFPLYRDESGDLLKSKLLLVSPLHGVVLFGIATDVKAKALRPLDAEVAQIFSSIYSRLLRNKSLRKSKTQLVINASAAIYAPNITTTDSGDFENEIIRSNAKLETFLGVARTQAAINKQLYADLVATVEGAKGLMRPKSRSIDESDSKSLGALLSKIESEIAGFDIKQRHGYIIDIDGPQRIRGLAGSGKTIVLAMKAALTHLRYPDAKILYTFHTKSLYQQIRRLITRFYRQYDDRDPDWDRVNVLHAWGGINVPGVYYETCKRHSITPLRFGDAQRESNDPFDYSCQLLEQTATISPAYDYVLIDEGQDFPASFVRICAQLAKGKRFVYAYDDLQTIFRPHSPTPTEIFGADEDGNPKVEFTEDIVLYKCYRNPREVLVAAHALGFGVYGSHIVQMLESKEHWQDIGYKVQGELKAGMIVDIERPPQNSLATVSAARSPAQIVQAFAFNSLDEEVKACVSRIKSDLASGVRQDDILVVCVDDRNAKDYLNDIATLLEKAGISANNLHADPTGLRDFYQADAVTLSTVHKAKGNESYVVHVVGGDSPFSGIPDVRARNIIFTAMTRAKAIVYVSGVGVGAKTLAGEIEVAIGHFPSLHFKYPGKGRMKQISRDLREQSARKQEAERRLDEILSFMTPQEIQEYVSRGPKRKKRRSGDPDEEV